MSSTKKLATSAVTAGIRKIEPTTIPSPAAIDRIQARMLSNVCQFAPSTLSAQTSPSTASQTSSRCSANPIAKISTSCESDRFQQDRPERRRQHLGQRPDGGIKHSVISAQHRQR